VLMIIICSECSTATGPLQRLMYASGCVMHTSIVIVYANIDNVYISASWQILTLISLTSVIRIGSHILGTFVIEGNGLRG